MVRHRVLRRRAVEQLRQQIARDLHDDIGSNLGGIVLLSEIGSKHSADPQSRADFLTIKEAADDASASMRDIVWLIQRGHFGLRDLVTKMRQSARMIVGDKEVSVEVEPPDFRDHSLSLLFRRHVFFAFKETLNNVRKHADAGTIEVRMQVDSTRLTFIVRDDGIDFDLQAAELPGHGSGASGYILKASGIDQIGEAIRQVMDGGAPMTPEVARKVLDAFTAIDQGPGGTNEYNLTPRECDILRLMADGLVKKEIGKTLGISVHTVSTHMQRVYEKLHVTTNTGAVAKALRERLI